MTQTQKSGPPGRISQLLPTVTCSNCNAPVPLTELGDHVCEVAPPLPPSSSSLLPARLQGLVSRSTPQVTPPAASSPLRRGTPSINTPPSPRSNGPALSAPFVRKHSEQLSPGWIQSHNSSPSSSDRSSSRNAPLSERLRSASASGRDPPGPFAERDRTYSSFSRSREPSLPSLPFPSIPLPSIPLPSPSRDKTLCNTSKSSSLDDRRPPLDSRGHINAASRPSFDGNSRSPYESIRPPLRKNPDAPEPEKLSLPSSPLPFPPSPNPPQSPLPLQPDTKIGGEAGMAGVGRRGYFAAAARAAMFAATAGHAVGGAGQDSGGNGMDGWCANPPKYLDTSTANSSHCEFHFYFSLIATIYSYFTNSCHTPAFPTFRLFISLTWTKIAHFPRSTQLSTHSSLFYLHH